MAANKDITVLVPTSPISSHPSVEVIERALDSIREQLPSADIIVMLDGIRTEQEHYREAYMAYHCELAKLILKKYKHVGMFPFGKFQHQAEMLRQTLLIIDTPLVMFFEHDCLFTDDGPIDWEGICELVKSGEINQLQFSCQLEPWLQKDSLYLMLDTVRKYVQGVPLVRTWQFSGRPSVASAQFYRRIIASSFRKNSRSFLEDRIGSIMLATFLHDQSIESWDSWRVAYYTPESNIRRTATVDGRQSDPKFEVTF